MNRQPGVTQATVSGPNGGKRERVTTYGGGSSATTVDWSHGRTFSGTTTLP
ncbi:hypothetical protein [Cyanobium sp. Morenito 9A2]|uniref:hypothetical protein n=1 Tax=Cyanobium sp. Morenito 9A2 TaxID=2823718 RepID=UPI0020CE7D97|nr:hypothetical protein [Cyanobium sp. Morenito 9A2]MCP9849069.1 hypothetical protein [Cyanobium sp. Morenito 9A2]